MKNILLLICILTTLTAQSQIGISAGANFSNFNSGMSQVNLINTGVRAGVYYDQSFYSKRLHVKQTNLDEWRYYTRHKSNWGISTGLYYLHLGQRNEKELYRNFSTYHIHLPVMLSYRGMFAGGYVNRMVYARNNSLSGPTFGWSVKDWGYYLNHWNYGLTGGFKVNLMPIKISVIALYGLRTGRTNKWTFEGDKASKDRAVSVNLEIPFSIFKN